MFYCKTHDWISTGLPCPTCHLPISKTRKLSMSPSAFPTWTPPPSEMKIPGSDLQEESWESDDNAVTEFINVQLSVSQLPNMLSIHTVKFLLHRWQASKRRIAKTTSSNLLDIERRLTKLHADLSEATKRRKDGHLVLRFPKTIEDLLQDILSIRAGIVIAKTEMNAEDPN